MKNYRYVARNTSIASRALGDETMIMCASNSTLITLDEVASVIWDAADGVTPLDEIVASKICAKYEITPEVALKDAEALVENMAEHGIALLSDQPLAQSSSSRRGA